MEYEYRYLSEERAAEIDSKGFTNNLGRKRYINSGRSVTNYNETVVFQQTWVSHENEEADTYFLAYKENYYFIDVFTLDTFGKDIDGCVCWCFVYNIVNIYSSKFNKEEYLLNELLEVLKGVLYVRSQHIGLRKGENKTEITVMYKGEEV